jgi:hypothetical protein
MVMRLRLGVLLPFGHRCCSGNLTSRCEMQEMAIMSRCGAMPSARLKYDCIYI